MERDPERRGPTCDAPGAWLAGPVIAAVLFADWTTKVGATAIGRRWWIVDPHVNPALALGALPATGWRSLAVMAASFAVAVHASVLFRRGLLAPWAFAALMGGIVANAADRGLTGAVHDWIHLGRVVANLADVAVLTGVVAYTFAALASVGADVSGTSSGRPPDRREGVNT